MTNKSAQTKFDSVRKGFIHPVLIGVVVLILLIVVLVLTGVLKFSGSIKYNKSQSPATTSEEKSVETKPVSVPVVKSETSLSEKYTHESPGYSLNYPGDWAIVQSGKAVALFSKEGGASSTEQSEAGIIITTSSLGKLAGSKLSTIADISRSPIKDEFPGATITSEEDIKLGDYDAHVYNMVYPNKGADWQAKFYVLIDAENLYGLVATTNKPKWSKYENTLKAIIESFKLP